MRPQPYAPCITGGLQMPEIVYTIPVYSWRPEVSSVNLYQQLLQFKMQPKIVRTEPSSFAGRVQLQPR